MIIALDYDGTYTADPELWLKFVKDALCKGHSVLCVTMRYPHEGATMDERLKALIPIHFTSRQAKLAFMMDKQIIPTVWIDDNPGWIFHNSI